MKGNLFLGFGRGKVGDVVFSRADGEQIARARNRQPKNPQTPLQLLQRVCMKTTSLAYSFMQEICNHSFQGASEGTGSQARFVKANIDYFRNLLALEINSGDPEDILECTECNFSGRNAKLPAFNPYIVSEGSLTVMKAAWNGSVKGFSSGLELEVPPPDTPLTQTYQQVCDSNGLQKGDQLTFLMLSIDDTDEIGVFNGFKFARIILEPSDGDMSKVFLTGNAPNYAINDPNPKNEGLVNIQIDGSQLVFSCSAFSSNPGASNTLAAGATIVSRLVGSTWQRSNSKLVLRPDTVSATSPLSTNHAVDMLGDAIYSFMNDATSTLYLNQAES